MVVKSLISVKNLKKQFKVPKKKSGFKGTVKGLFSHEYTIKNAVDDISFEIDQGETVGYIGPNGAGKSTTIKMISGILVPTSGQCLVNGVVPYKNRKFNAKNIGVVFGQRTQLWWDLPLTETFSVLKEIYEIDDKQFRKNVSFLYDVLDLDEFVTRSVRTLSLGQRMKADLAASLLHNPKILYLDEPTIGLDVIAKEKLRKAIDTINKEFETTVILTTHDLKDIEEICNRIIIIDKGKKVYDGDLNEIRDDYGYMTTVQMEIRDIEKISKVNFYNELKIDPKYLAFSINGTSLSVRFNKKKISTAQVISYIMQEFNVINIEIKETDINEIIKQVYSNEPMEKMKSEK